MAWAGCAGARPRSIVTPSLDPDWVRPLAGLRPRGVAALACIIDPLAHDAPDAPGRGPAGTWRRGP